MIEATQIGGAGNFGLLSAILDMPLLLQPSRARPKGTLLLDLIARILLLLQLLG